MVLIPLMLFILGVFAGHVADEATADDPGCDQVLYRLSVDMDAQGYQVIGMQQAENGFMVGFGNRQTLMERDDVFAADPAPAAVVDSLTFDGMCLAANGKQPHHYHRVEKVVDEAPADKRT